MGQYFECRYEMLLENTQMILKEILKFCGLKWENHYEKHINSIPINSDNLNKWRKELNDSAINTIKTVACNLLSELGYTS